MPTQASHLLFLLQNCTAELLTAVYNHHHPPPKLSHNTPLPDLSTLCEPVANIEALGFSKYVAILEFAN